MYAGFYLIEEGYQSRMSYIIDEVKRKSSLEYLFGSDVDWFVFLDTLVLLYSFHTSLILYRGVLRIDQNLMQSFLS